MNTKEPILVVRLALCFFNCSVYMLQCLHSIMKVWFSVLSLIMPIGIGFSNAQFKVLEDNSARIFIVGGGRVDFAFNSINKWQTGITYNNFTVIGIHFVDSIGGVGPWELMFRANNSDGIPLTMPGDNGNFIELNKIGVRAENAANLVAPAICYDAAFKPLTDADQILARGNIAVCGTVGVPCLATGALPRQIFIDWSFGVLNTILGEAPDHYAEDIILTLQPTTGVPCP